MDLVRFVTESDSSRDLCSFPVLFCFQVTYVKENISDDDLTEVQKAEGVNSFLDTRIVQPTDKARQLFDLSERCLRRLMGKRPESPELVAVLRALQQD